MKIAKTAGAVVTSLGLVVGMSAFAGATQGSLTNSGDHNKIHQSSNTKTITKVKNNNAVGVFNFNGQEASSGDASVHGGSSSGSATTGDTSNSNTTSTTVSVDNSPSSVAALSATPADSSSATVNNSGDHNSLSQHVDTTTVTKVTNNNLVLVGNVNLQEASSGDASVHGGNSSGSATTGAASNTSSTTTAITVKN